MYGRNTQHTLGLCFVGVHDGTRMMMTTAHLLYTCPNKRIILCIVEHLKRLRPIPPQRSRAEDALKGFNRFGQSRAQINNASALARAFRGEKNRICCVYGARYWGAYDECVFVCVYFARVSRVKTPTSKRHAQWRSPFCMDLDGWSQQGFATRTNPIHGMALIAKYKSKINMPHTFCGVQTVMVAGRTLLPFKYAPTVYTQTHVCAYLMFVIIAGLENFKCNRVCVLIRIQVSRSALACPTWFQQLWKVQHNYKKYIAVIVTM